jgi:transposase InsO family protein
MRLRLADTLLGARKSSRLARCELPVLPGAPNLLGRPFSVAVSDKVWAGEITCSRTHEGWPRLKVVIDLFGRRAVGRTARGT